MLKEQKRPNNRKKSRFERHSHEVGCCKESLAMKALHGRPLPSWIRSYARCGPSDDMDGKDLCIATDLGDIFIQIKSSEEGREKYLKKGKRDYPVEVVIIRQGFSLDLIGRLILHAAGRLRAALYRQGLRPKSA
jgi:hypothetical protein